MTARVCQVCQDPVRVVAVSREGAELHLCRVCAKLYRHKVDRVIAVIRNRASWRRVPGSRRSRQAGRP